MQSNEVLLLEILFGAALLFASMVYWFISLGPQRAVAKVLAQPAQADREIPQFKNIDREWITYRMLPLPGLKTIWKIQTSDGLPVGRILIVGFQKGERRGSHAIEIGDKEFWIKKNMEGFLQNGFIVCAKNLQLKLVGDANFGVSNTLKTNFRNLILENGNDKIAVRGAENRTIVLLRNEERIGVATYLEGTFPGFAAMSPKATELEKAILFYCRLTR